MEDHRKLLVKAIVVLMLAIVANIGSTDHLIAEAPSGTPFSCVACFLEDNRCEELKVAACDMACSSPPTGECQEYDEEEVSCETEETVYEYVRCGYT